MSAPYLLSSLPTLELGAQAPFTPEEYRHQCEGIEGLNLGDLDAVAIGIAGSHPFTVAYANALLEIKSTTAAMRASGWEGENIRVSERSYAGCHVDLQQKIIEACNIKNPYEREVALEKARWQIVEELAGIGYFSEAKIYAYIIKLQINNRLAGLSDEQGKANIEEFIKANDREVAQN
ncbi:MAG: DUF2764 domain-containing protein [Fibromonadaceae bacterium]|jgi:hypothetical protein|nr:DUF2764 domain-containing protein [Fibromonadaceae bacterium]